MRRWGCGGGRRCEVVVSWWRMLSWGFGNQGSWSAFVWAWVVMVFLVVFFFSLMDRMSSVLRSAACTVHVSRVSSSVPIPTRLL